MNVPPALELSDDVPQPHRVSDAAKRRRLRAQLVQEHIAKITQEELGSQEERHQEDARHQEVEDFAATRSEVVEARGGRICTIVFDTPCGHSAGRLKLVTGFERLEVEDDDEDLTGFERLEVEDDDEDPQRLVESKQQETANKLQQKQSKHRQSTPAPMEVTNIHKSPEDPKKVHSAGRKHAGQKLKKEVDGAMAHVPALRGPPLHQAQRQDKVPQKRLNKVAKSKGASVPEKETTEMN
jgi:hypothetical protein